MRSQQNKRKDSVLKVSKKLETFENCFCGTFCVDLWTGSLLYSSTNYQLNENFKTKKDSEGFKNSKRLTKILFGSFFSLSVLIKKYN